jgi:mono/diheme cytochrome c family protein
MSSRSALTSVLFVAGAALVATTASVHAGRVPGTQAPASAAATPAEARALIDQYCVGCHSDRLKSGGLVLANLDVEQAGPHAETWEKVVKKLQGGAMPPAGSRRPDRATYQTLISALEGTLDRAAQQAPNPGRPPIHRLNRLEYSNSSRDLFGFEIDGRTMLPADDSGFGFDNIADVLSMSPGLLERYLLAAAKIARLAVGDATMRPGVTTYQVGDQTLGQDDRMSEDLPFGSRGGVAIRHYFPLDGEYRVKFYLQRSDVADSNVIRGLDVTNMVDVRLDRKRVEVFTIGGEGKNPSYAGQYTAQEFVPDSEAEARFFAKAGTHVVGVSLNRDNWEMEGVGIGRLPLTSIPFNRGRNSFSGYGRVDMTIQKVFIAGPFDAKAPVDSEVYRRLFVCRPTSADAEEPCARRILSAIARRAYRRPVTDAEVGTLLDFYRSGRSGMSFEAGIQNALERMLVDINFLFRMEHDPDGALPGSVNRVSDLELASRLSFFLWSSIPDDELLNVAAQGHLGDSAVLEQQVRRMLADRRSDVMVDNFFGQWLFLRNMSSHRPDPHLFPEFDESLRAAFQQETSLFLKSQIREDRPVTEILSANYTFVNERLARHYGIPDVLGSHFRRITLTDDTRAGLLGHGSVLTVTSYADRTSVVMRGKYILQNLLGIPPPPPPPNVPPLDDTVVNGSLRQRMESHRKNPVCASCHAAIDPLGFALENFDGIGKFRTHDGNASVDASGVMVDGTKFDGPVTFRKALLSRQDAVLGTTTEKLLTYALGRGVEFHDIPAVRQILRDSASADHRWSAVILAIVKSTPFQMRRAQS